ncbi:MAG: pyruvate kinase [Pseudomonadota bacterium]|nr:pyruvate kinase [Pseudomonadota bacterium]
MNTPIQRRTKIIATLGPATDHDGVLEDMISEGLNVVRINYSHGDPADHVRRAERVREISAARQCHIGILGDLQGPKIRIGRFAEGRVTLNPGDPFVLDSRLDTSDGDVERVGITYPSLPEDVRPGDTLLLDDGRVVLDVEQVARHEISTRVRVGGVLGDSKGINRQGGGLSAPSLTDKDRKDIELASRMDVDYLAVSFPRTAEDIREARLLLRGAGGGGGIIAKIERPEALECIDEIIEASDGIMIARGDLGVEIGDAELPAVQKRLITKARNMNRVVITATQMMETMSFNPIPTRAEVFDVANAVLDGTDAVMLSGETAVGKYPVQAIEAMSRICLAAETQRVAKRSDHRIDTRFQRVDEAIAMATMYTANHLGVRAIAALSESGSTPLWMSRISSAIPIYALTGHDRTSRKVTLYRGVYPANIETTQTSHAKANRDAVDVLKQRGVVQDGDLVLITKGDLMGVDGGTNAMKIVRVGELVDTE